MTVYTVPELAAHGGAAGGWRGRERRGRRGRQRLGWARGRRLRGGGGGGGSLGCGRGGELAAESEDLDVLGGHSRVS